MAAFADEWLRRAPMPDNEADAQTDKLRRALLELDPDALGTPDCWWALVLEQMRDGLL